MSCTADDLEAALDSFEAAVGVQAASRSAAEAECWAFSRLEGISGAVTAFDFDELRKLHEH